MRSTTLLRSRWATISAAICLAAFSGTAAARATRVDFNTATSDAERFAITGSLWNSSGLFTSQLDALAAPAGGDLAFAINVGGTTYGGFCMSEDGFLGLVSASGSACSGASADYSAAFGVFAANLTSAFDAQNPSPTNDAALSVATGISVGLPSATVQPPYDLTTATTVDVQRFTWNRVTADGTEFPGLTFQIFLYDLGNGDFDLEFAYGTGSAGDSSYSGGTQFISSGGTNLFTTTGALTSATNYFFSFRDGALSDGGTPPDPTTVPEPSSIALLLIALLGLAAAMRPRLRRSNRFS